MYKHKTSQDDGVVRNSISIEGLSTSKSVHNLPHYYTDVAPISALVKGHLYLLELLSVSKEITTNPTRKRKIDG